jgi:putative membrane protein
MAAMKFLAAGGKQFETAIEAVEAASAVEVVVAVRPRLRRWPSANAAIGVVCALFVLGFELYSEELEFDYWAIMALPLVAGLVGGMLVELVPSLQRALTPRRVRRESLLEAARATFYELGVHKTRGRSGLLVFVAIRDRAVTMVGDVAIMEKLGQRRLDSYSARLAQAMPGGAEAVARVLSELAPTFGKALPRGVDDANELANEVHVKPRTHPRRYV